MMVLASILSACAFPQFTCRQQRGASCIWQDLPEEQLCTVIHVQVGLTRIRQKVGMRFQGPEGARHNRVRSGIITKNYKIMAQAFLGPLF